MTETLRLHHPPVTVRIHRNRRARRLTLSVPHTGDGPRLTAPMRATEAEIRRFLARQADWLAAALDRAPAPLTVAPGLSLPVAGAMLSIQHRSGPRRPPQIVGDTLVLSGGPAMDCGPRIRAWLIERARGEVSRIAHACAAALGAKVGKIGMRDPKSRWGSCTSRGDLSFSWRLAMAPPSVLDYVAAHEAAHLREMNHGPEFWRLVEELRPNWRVERDWLRREGGTLQRYRFTAETEDEG